MYTSALKKATESNTSVVTKNNFFIMSPYFLKFVKPHLIVLTVFCQGKTGVKIFSFSYTLIFPFFLV
jgi:hypothetical protein